MDTQTKREIPLLALGTILVEAPFVAIRSGYLQPLAGGPGRAFIGWAAGRGREPAGRWDLCDPE